MNRPHLKRRRIAALCAAALIIGSGVRAAGEDFPIYFPDSKLVVRAETVSRIIYLPVVDIIQYLGLPYTDALALETLTVRSGSSRLIVTRNSALISINDEIALLRSPVLRENNRWLAPIEFLNHLTRIAGTPFRYQAGKTRIFAGDVEAPELVMNAQNLGPITRLTIRSGAPLNIDIRRDESNNRAILVIDRAPVDPLRERIEQKDRLVHSIAFNDADGEPKIVLETTAEAGEIKITPADENRLFFVDVLRKVERSAEAPAAAAIPAPKPDTPPPQRKVRVVVIDPGHGGTDSGARNPANAEKDLTLAIARRLRTVLQRQLGATVLLTRDSDIELDNEARAAVANNNQANVFVSLHTGYSADKTDSGSSIFVMQDNFGPAPAPGESRTSLFLPWYLGYRTSRQASVRIAGLLQEELTKAVPGWKFPVRTAPLGVLASTTMPALVLEIGNINNSINVQTLVDGSFQDRFVNAVATAIQRFSADRAVAN